MKNSKIVTPTLLFLMVILLLIAIYYNFLYKPLETKVEALSMQNELIKNQRIEIEIAMKNIDAIKMDIEKMKEILVNNQENKLIDGKMLADDINTNSKAFNIKLSNIIIGEPQFADVDSNNFKALICIPVNISYITTYENGANFIGSFENSIIGAYKINSLDITEGEKKLLNWNVSLNLYYYGDTSVVPIVDQSDANINDGEAREWTQ